MTTHHIQRFIEMDDQTFLKHAGYYRKFQSTNDNDHKQNVQYLQDRLNKLGYVLEPGCCNNYVINKKEKQNEIQQRQKASQEIRS